MKSYSGKFVLRLSPSLHKKLAKQADERLASLNQFCTLLLEQGLVAPFLEEPWRMPLDTIVATIKKKFSKNLIGVLIFGSRIRGEASKSSDIDILIVLDPRVQLTRALYRWWDQTIEKTAFQFSPHFVHYPSLLQKVGSLWFEVALSHEILYQQEQKLDQLFQELNLFLQKQKLQRKEVHGHPYWMRQA